MYERILIAYDGSKEAERALNTGLKLAAALNSQVVVATIAEPLPGYYNIAAMVAPDVPEKLRSEHLERLGSLQARAGIEMRAVVFVRLPWVLHPFLLA